MVDDPAATPVVVKPNQGAVDTVTALGRLVLVIISTAPAAVLLLKKGDLIGLYDYFHTNQGQALAGAIVGLAAFGYGLYKSWKRGRQVANVAANPRVPQSVAKLK